MHAGPCLHTPRVLVFLCLILPSAQTVKDVVPHSCNAEGHDSGRIVWDADADADGSEDGQAVSMLQVHYALKEMPKPHAPEPLPAAGHDAAHRVGVPFTVLAAIALLWRFYGWGWTDAPSKEDVEKASDVTGPTSPVATAPAMLPAAAPSVPKVRFAYLDNVKMLCMASVFVVHAVSHSQNDACQEDIAFGNILAPPAWGPSEAVKYFMWVYNMKFFAFCSGAVASSEVSSARVQSIFTGILLPTMLIQIWNLLFWRLPAGDHLAWGGIITSMEPYYMYCLIIWKGLLLGMGNINEFLLLAGAIAFHVLYPMALSDGYVPMWPIYNYVALLGPFFFLGHVLCKRMKLLEPYIAFLNERPIFRTVCFVLYFAGWIDVFASDNVHRFLHTVYKSNLFPEVNPSLNDAFSKLVLLCMHVIGGVVATAWLPTAEVPVISRAGKYTLYGYFLQTVKRMNWHFWMLYGPRSSATMYWVSLILFQPFYCLLVCSEPVRFLHWPILQPSWFGKDSQKTSFSEICDVPIVKSLGPKKWLRAFILFHGTWVLAVWRLGPFDCHSGGNF